MTVRVGSEGDRITTSLKDLHTATTSNIDMDISSVFIDDEHFIEFGDDEVAVINKLKDFYKEHEPKF